MSNAVVGALRVTLGMDSAAFTEGLSEAQKRLKDTGSKLQAIGTKMAGLGAVVGAAMVGAVAAVNQITSGLVEMGNEAKTAGVAFEEFQKLKYVADQAGVSIEALTDGLKEMQLRADEFAKTGGGSAAEAFERIGLSGADLTEALKNPAAMFDDIVARIGKLDTAAQIRVADEIFGGTGGEQFVRLLDLGADGIAKLKEEFVANGGLIPQEQVDKAAEFQQAIGKVKAALTGIGTNALMDSGLIEFLTDAIPRVVAFGKALAETFGPKVKALGDAMLAMFGALGDVIISLFGGKAEATAALMAWGQAIKITFTAAIEIITASVNVITNVLKALGALLRGDFSAMWGFLGSAAMSAVRGIGNAFETLFPGVISSVSRMVTGVRDWLVTRFASMVVEPVRQKIEAVKGFFFGLYDAVVGHSYIPDMVEGVAAWMGKLDAGMVVPARNATAQAKQAFQDLRDDVAAIMEGLLTDAERNAREVAAKIAKIRALAQQGGMTKGEAATAEAGVWGENLKPAAVPQIDPSQDMIDPRAREALDGLAQTASQTGAMMQEAIGGISDATRSLADGLIDLAMTGEGSLGDLLKNFVKTVAQIILQMLALKAVELLTGIPVSAMLGGAGGGGGGFGGGGGSPFGGFKLPGFARGGGFNVAGSGTTDSKIVAFRATPGERVDISTPRQQRQQGGGASVVHVNPSKYFDVVVQQVATPLIASASIQAAKAGSGMAQTSLARQAAFSRGR